MNEHDSALSVTYARQSKVGFCPESQWWKTDNKKLIRDRRLV